MAKRPMLISGVLLGLFGIIGSALVALTWEGTAERIAQNEREALLRQITTLVPAAEIDNDMLADTREVSSTELLGADSTTVYTGRKDGKAVAVVLSPVIAPDGYNGAIRLIVGVRADGRLAGVRVLSHRETPGLGDKIDIRKDDWIERFTGRSLINPLPKLWQVKKDGGEFDQFTGATITPRAVVKAVRKSLNWVRANQQDLFKATQIEASKERSHE